MAFRIDATYSKGETLRAVLRKLASDVEGDYWDHANDQWAASPAAGGELITLTESNGQY